MAQSGGASVAAKPGHPVLVIGASSLGTVFEWYDFYLYGSLASFITKQFFSGVNETTGYIFALLAFAAVVGLLFLKDRFKADISA